jgi:two-component system, NarL family, nitrate/nitrite response regulator NarL
VIPEYRSPQDEKPANSDRISVGVLAESELIRRGLDSVLRQLPQVIAIKHFADQADAQFMSAAMVDVAIVTVAGRNWLPDLGEPGRISIPKVLLIIRDPDQLPRELVASAPVDGLLLQDDFCEKELADALRQLMAGHTPMPAEIAKKLLAGTADAPANAVTRPAILTHRERETLALLVDGLSNKQIARSLGVSSHGAKRLVGSVLMKLGAPNRTAAAVNAIKAGLVDAPLI